MYVYTQMSTMESDFLIPNCFTHVTCMSHNIQVQHSWKTSQIHAYYMKHACYMHIYIQMELVYDMRQG